MTKRQIPRFLSRTQVAERIGLKNVRSLSGVSLPEPDAMIGAQAGWRPETIDAWQATRPGYGRWGSR